MRAALIAVLFLAGCETCPKPPIVISPQPPRTTSPATDKPIDAVKQTIEIDERLLIPCDALPKFVSINPTPKHVLEQKALEVAVYSTCAAKNVELVNLIRKYWNVQEQK